MHVFSMQKKRIFIILLFISILIVLPFVSAFSIKGFFINLGKFLTGRAVFEYCTDTDYGIVYYTFGYVNSTYYQYQPDICLTSNLLLEMYCSGTNPANTTFNCPNGCLNGACNNLTTCAAGWKCKDAYYRGYQNTNCSWSYLTLCQYGCGATGCVLPSLWCTDSDNGINYYQYGYANSTYSEYNPDVCLTSSILLETYCLGNSTANVTYACPYGCSSGRCNNASCTAGWKCKDNYTKALQYANCAWENITNCPYGCSNGECSPPQNQTCTDGTYYGSCSITKPKYCYNGNLISNCSFCGCPTGKICLLLNESCIVPSPPQGVVISQEDASQSFNCVLGSCSVAQQIVPQTTFNATKIGFKFGGMGTGTATLTLRSSIDGPIISTTGSLAILTNGDFTEGDLNAPVTLFQVNTYYLQVDSTVPGTILFYFAYENPYPYGIASTKVSYGWMNNNPSNGDFAFRIYSLPDQTCAAGWKCKDAYYMGYQNTDCSWSSVSRCLYGCGGAVCNAQSLFCTDTDNGHNYYIFGNVNSSISGYQPDVCISNSILLETYCIGNNSYNETVTCPYGCLNGACLPPSNLTCIDHEGEINYYVKGTVTTTNGSVATNYSDFCDYTAQIIEYYCSGNMLSSATITCPNGCSNGECQSQPGECVDGEKESKTEYDFGCQKICKTNCKKKWLRGICEVICRWTCKATPKAEYERTCMNGKWGEWILK